MAGWRAQDLYNEYLDIKADLDTSRRGYNSMHFNDEVRDGMYEDIVTLEDRLRDVLEYLTLEGVDMKDLVLLSAGVEVDLFK